MTCPRCHRSLEENERDESRFGNCPQCGGVWIDFEELDRIFEAAIGEGLPRPAASSRLPESGDSPLRCPRCEGGLVAVRSEEHIYSACIVCYGRWVDGSDLPEAGGLSRRIKKLFRKFVEGGKK